MKIISKILDKFRIRIVQKPIVILKTPNDVLANKVAIVTGGSSGIGYSIAKAMTMAGAKVYVLGRNEQKLKNVSEQLGCSYRVVDINDISAMEAIVSEITKHENIDILVNSAGTHGSDTFGDVTEKTFDAVMSTNVKSLYFISQAVANHMIEKGIHGHILNVSSASSIKPSWTPYEISKRAVNGITQGMAHKLIKYGIVVNGIAPGPTATPMLGKPIGGGIQWGANPSGRMSLPEEIASLALFMVSQAGDGIVGDTFFMTGGSGTICIDK